MVRRCNDLQTLRFKNYPPKKRPTLSHPRWPTIRYLNWSLYNVLYQPKGRAWPARDTRQHVIHNSAHNSKTEESIQWSLSAKAHLQQEPRKRGLYDCKQDFRGPFDTHRVCTQYAHANLVPSPAAQSCANRGNVCRWIFICRPRLDLGAIISVVIAAIDFSPEIYKEMGRKKARAWRNKEGGKKYSRRGGNFTPNLSRFGRRMHNLWFLSHAGHVYSGGGGSWGRLGKRNSGALSRITRVY